MLRKNVVEQYYQVKIKERKGETTTVVVKAESDTLANVQAKRLAKRLIGKVLSVVPFEESAESFSGKEPE